MEKNILLIVRGKIVISSLVDIDNKYSFGINESIGNVR